MEMLKSVSMIRLQKITSFVLLADSVSSSQCPLKKKANKKKKQTKENKNKKQVPQFNSPQGADFFSGTTK